MQIVFVNCFWSWSLVLVNLNMSYRIISEHLLYWSLAKAITNGEGAQQHTKVRKALKKHIISKEGRARVTEYFRCTEDI
jgi:hypothetical protein